MQKYIQKTLFFLLLSLFLTGVWSFLSYAQSENNQIRAPFLVDNISAEITKIKETTNLSEDDKTAILEIYERAINEIKAGNSSIEQAGIYDNIAKTADKRIKQIDNNIAKINKTINKPQSDILKQYKDMSVEEYQQELDAERAKSSLFRNRIEELQLARQTLDKRPGLAVQELAEIEKQIETLSAQVQSELKEDAGDLEKAAKELARARLYSARAKKRELEREIATLPSRRKILEKEINLTSSQIRNSHRLITILSDVTGAARVELAKARLEDAKSELDNLSTAHPLLVEYAKKNYELAKKNLAIAKSEGNLPEIETRISRQLQQVKLDKNVVDQILASRKVNKAYGEHLRSLRKKQPKLSSIQSEIKTRESDLQDALFQRITAQESLAIFNSNPFDIDELKTEFDEKNGVSPKLTPSERDVLHRLYESRRSYLDDLATITTLKARKLAEVNSLHKKLYDDVKNLSELLDGRLLWLPSAEPIGLSWPAKVIKGAGQVFSPNNLKQVFVTFVSGIKISSFLVFLLLGLLSAFVLMHGKVKEYVEEMQGKVGRVQQDRYILTPIAILDGILAALPIAGLFVISALILSFGIKISDFPRRLISSLVFIAAPVAMLIALRAWSRDGALFDLHFNVDKQLRDRVYSGSKPLLFFIPVGVLLVGITMGSFEYDSAAAALGVFGFLLASLSISWFAFKLIWKRSVDLDKEVESIYLRNERWFLLVAVLLPLGTAILAALGYFETAKLLLTRMFLTFCLLVFAYIIHGLLKRSVEIAQRRLALEQAKRRRDRMVRERMEKAAAEERGEIAVPKVDTESIDLETISRQSRQLVNIIVFIAVVVLLSALWKDILPALSVINDVKVWDYQIKTADGPVTQYITLWNILQAIFIALITILAGRNLPGFLEIFVLKRMNMAQGSRFAIITVLGYFIFIIGMLIALDKLGVQWSSMQWIIAALGVGIGFGLQAIFANFISGLIILFERPIRIGDYVTVGDISGTVTRIQIRATTLLDLDNKEILIPNQELISQRVTNWTLANPITRLIIKVGIAYGSDTELAHKTMLETIRANKNVLNNPEPTVLFLGFGESSLDFEIRVFLRDFTQRFMVSHELHMAIDAALREVDIEIAFPQRDIHIRTGEGIEQLVETIKPKKSKAKKA